MPAANEAISTTNSSNRRALPMPILVVSRRCPCGFVGIILRLAEKIGWTTPSSRAQGLFMSIARARRTAFIHSVQPSTETSRVRRCWLRLVCCRGRLVVARGACGDSELRLQALALAPCQRALAEDDNNEECAILCESGARPDVLWFAS